MVRGLERTVASTTYADPYTGSAAAGSQTQAPIGKYQADQAELGALHMVTADPLRTPTFVSFASGEDYVENVAADCGGTGTTQPASCSNYYFVGIHGDYAPETNTTWAGLVGPGVKNNGVDTSDFTEHVDLRPTLLQLVGLKDDYSSDGRVITQVLDPTSNSTDPASLRDPNATQLGLLQKQLNAPVYESTEGAMDGFGTATLAADTSALKSGSSTDDSLYTTVEADITKATAQRNSVVSDIDARLTAAASGTTINPAAATQDQTQGQCLLAYANALKAYATNPATSPAPTDCSLALTAALPETSHAALLVLAAGVVMGAGLLLAGRHRRNVRA